MALTVSCPQCHAVYTCPDNALGKMLKCVKCQQAFRAPEPPVLEEDIPEVLAVEEEVPAVLPVCRPAPPVFKEAPVNIAKPPGGARAGVQDAWVAQADMAAVQERLREFIQKHRMSVVEDTSEKISVKQGSQLMTRLLGGWFVNPIRLPKMASFSLQAAEGGVRIQATFEEAMGMGIMDLMLKEKYQKYMEDLLEDLRRTVV